MTPDEKATKHQELKDAFMSGAEDITPMTKEQEDAFLKKNAVPQKPSISRDVHLVGGAAPTSGFFEKLHLAAKVTGVNADETVSLIVWPPGSRDQFFAPVAVKYSESMEPGTWHWPERP